MNGRNYRTKTKQNKLDVVYIPYASCSSGSRSFSIYWPSVILTEWIPNAQKTSSKNEMYFSQNIVFKRNLKACYRVRQFVITKYDRYYKLRRLLQSATQHPCIKSSKRTTKPDARTMTRQVETNQ